MQERGQRSGMGTRHRFRIKRDLRLEAARVNVSQNKLARACGVSSGYMSQLLSGDRCVGPSVRARLMEVFKGFSFDQLFEEVEP
jgi:transcriptional regulator with XRE-family HTH domain